MADEVEDVSMQHVMRLRDAGQEAASKHAFFDWLSSDRVPAADRLAIDRPVPCSSCNFGT